MHRALLHELQRQTGYPSVTVLVNTTPGEWFDDATSATIDRLIDDAARRLLGDVPDDVREHVIGALRRLQLEEATGEGGEAIALCASPTYDAAVRLGRPVIERVVVDETFATRDLVADLHRTATFRVITVSEHVVRMLYGNERRLAESVDEQWPLVREEDQTVASWTRAVVHALRAEQRRHPVPTVVAGVERSVRRALGAAELDAIGVVPGNHDRSGWSELHRAAWPMVAEWVEGEQLKALDRLDTARSQRRFAAGVDEVWTMAMEGRLELVVVEDTYAVAARVLDRHLQPADQVEDPDVVDDVVDEIIEAVMRHGGGAVIVPDGRLAEHERIAAVARY
jgi:Bacterial archaeo-eukaryotic release factor family 3